MEHVSRAGKASGLHDRCEQPEEMQIEGHNFYLSA
jgi:hypothetical protein